MKNKRYILIIPTIMSMIFLLASCASTTDNAQAERIQREPQAIVEAGHLAGEINILVEQYGDNDLRIYADLFNAIHPNVVINFETYQPATDMAEFAALTTRLMANPPDIFAFSTAGMNFEKVAHESLFVDLYDFFYGPRGIDQSEYFYNIFHALETSGGLFAVPLYVVPELIYLNRRFFDAIDVDWSAIHSMTFEQEIEYFALIQQALPDIRGIRANDLFSIWQLIERELLYDLETGNVYIDTPRMHGLVEQVIELYIPNPSRFIFMPTHKNFSVFGGSVEFADRILNNSNLMRLSRWDEWSRISIIFILQDHPNMQFSQPVVMARGENADLLEFSSHTSFSIMQNAANRDLAWEFLRFMLEFDESLLNWYENIVLPPLYAAATGNNLPINRTRFDAQFGSIIGRDHFATWHFTDLGDFVDISEEAHRELTISSGLELYRGIVESLNFEVRSNRAVLNSLVYPDIWLLYTNQQDIATTLANIQNRLELYVAE